MNQNSKRFRGVPVSVIGGLALLLGAPMTAMAQAGGGYFTNYYAGASAGWTSADDVTGDDDDRGWKLYGGASISEMLGAEVFYADLGEYGAAGALTDVSGFGVDVLAGLPITQQGSVFAKVGTMYANAERGASDESSFDLKYGLGARFNVTQNVAVRAEWEQYAIDNDVLESDVSLISLGVALRFQP